MFISKSIKCFFSDVQFSTTFVLNMFKMSFHLVRMCVVHVYYVTMVTASKFYYGGLCIKLSYFMICVAENSLRWLHVEVFYEGLCF